MVFCDEIGPRLGNLRGEISCRRQQAPRKTRDLGDLVAWSYNAGFYYSGLDIYIELLLDEFCKLGCGRYWVLVVGNMNAHSHYLLSGKITIMEIAHR